ncbi:MAG: oligosaccharide flippase family protein, partial [Mucilaginibacter sp.]
MNLLNKLRTNIVVKNFSYVTIGSILAQLINLVALVKIARVFSPGNYGVYTFLGVQAQLLFTLADLGLRNIIIRTIARNKSTTNDMLVNGILIRICSIILFSVFYFIYNYYAGSLSNRFVLLICIYAFFNCITALFESAFWGHQKMLPSAIINVATSLIWLTSVYLLPLKSITVENLFLILFVINIILAGTVFFIVLKAQKLLMGKVQPFLKSSMALLKESWPYFMLVLISLPFNYLTNNYLDINSTKAEIGYFNLTQKLMSPVSLVITYSMSALFPNISSLWVNDPQKFERFLSKGIQFFMVSALLLCFIFTLFAGEVITLLFKKSYAPVIQVAQLQIWYVFLLGVNSLIGTIWGATNNERKFIKSTFINVLIAAPLLYWGSKYGAFGLSFGYVVSF